MPTPIVLSPDVTLRLITADDAAALAAAYRRNRRHLAPWEPERNDDYFAEDHQRSDTRQLLDIAGQWQDHVLFQAILQS